MAREAATLLARRAPSHPRARRGCDGLVERGVPRSLYYGGVPLLLALRGSFALTRVTASPG